jgi:Arc/MetJ family transcription regulator
MRDDALTVSRFCGSVIVMQTTIQLDDVLLAEAAKLASEKGCDLSHLIEAALREKIARASHNPHIVPQPFGHLKR